MTAWDAVPFVLLLVKLLLVGISIVFLISGLDDCCIDLVFAIRALYRRLERHHLTEEAPPAMTRRPL